MKYDKGKVEQQKSVIRQLSFEVQALQEEAGRLDLPDNIQDILMSWMKDAETLPDELKQKSLIKKHLGVALNYYRRGDMGTVRLSVLRVMKLFENANHDKWVLGTEKQFGHNADKLRKHHEEVTKPKHDLWLEMADKFRSEYRCEMSDHKHDSWLEIADKFSLKYRREISNSELAKKIEAYLHENDPENCNAVGTIRKLIGRNRKKK
ncbi:hypothetical protein SAMN05216326_12927 [Nitrosomonas marina]|uniref:Uncharacterized protein n=1 Tax=Nitrosomonas marina TaxID=917 RepID=A0A1I0EP07_9PROT|nr:hypothetical protein [Nitrosomonas marina]SET47029.1 hypothetical protein SAMN05216326_12927 [Nitrosomonas marina]